MQKRFRLRVLAQLSAPLFLRPAAAAAPALAGWWSFYSFRRVGPPLVAAALAAALLPAAAPAARAQQPATPAVVAPTATQTVRGTVTDAQSGLGLPGATVRLVREAGPAVGTATGPDGTFRLTGVPLGRQTVRVSI